MTEEFKAEVSKWLAETEAVEKWNDITKLALYERAPKIVKQLLIELAHAKKR